MTRLLRLVLLLVVGACVLGVAAPPASRQPQRIAAGVEVMGVRVGGLTSEPARELIRTAVSRPLAFSHGGRSWRVPPAAFGSSAAIDAAVADALRAQAGGSVEVHIRADRKAVRRYVDWVGRRHDVAPTDARLDGLRGLRPRITRERAGLAVRRDLLARWIERALAINARGEIALPTRPVRPRVTRAAFGPVIVISRGANLLRLYDGPRLRREFRVATGAAEYPTPAGRWRIVDKQRDPWWRPPPSEWAEGLEPVPPGPGNPLGTRWMGLDAAAVGIHGTPDAASLGYSRSHGCIRMAIPEAEWLFAQVELGTPVLIV